VRCQDAEKSGLLARTALDAPQPFGDFGRAN
jgi:hypothetical protein